MSSKNYSFIKSQVSAFAATVTDFLVTLLLTELANVWYLISSITGTVAGGMLNFVLNRFWTFKSTKELPQSQAIRYFQVWLGSILLNASGMWIFTSLLNIQYVISKVIISAAVGLAFNYPFQKKYVFREKIS